jgi:hypothetical protein
MADGDLMAGSLLMGVDRMAVAEGTSRWVDRMAVAADRMAAAVIMAEIASRASRLTINRGGL